MSMTSLLVSASSHRRIARALGCVCTKNPVRIDLVTESLNLSGDGHAVMLLPDPVRLAVQVEEPT